MEPFCINPRIGPGLLLPGSLLAIIEACTCVVPLSLYQASKVHEFPIPKFGITHLVLPFSTIALPSVFTSATPVAKLAK